MGRKKCKKSTADKAKKQSPGAPKKWIPRLISVEDIVRAHVFEANYVSDTKSADRVRGDYKEWHALNKVILADKSPAEVALLWIGQMLTDEMATGSIQGCAAFVGVPHEVMKGTKKQHADAITKSAHDVDDASLIAFVNSAPADLQSGMFVILTTGAHAVDVKRLRNCQIRIAPDDHLFLEVDWYWTKSISKRGDRQSERYPLIMPAPPSFTRAQKKDRLVRPFSVTASKVSRVFKGLTTSLVFRRAAERRWSALDVPESQRARMLTHQNVKMIRAHYGFHQK